MANTHLEALTSRHKILDGQIAAEMRRPVPDAATLSRLKREKLKLKDAIARTS
ncbi:MAG: YdcH family protein [Sphingomonadaceae bacterium]